MLMQTRTQPYKREQRHTYTHTHKETTWNYTIPENVFAPSLMPISESRIYVGHLQLSRREQWKRDAPSRALKESQLVRARAKAKVSRLNEAPLRTEQRFSQILRKEIMKANVYATQSGNSLLQFARFNGERWRKIIPREEIAVW